MKKTLALALALLLALSLFGCTKTETPASQTPESETPASAEPVTLRIAASPTPHAEILEQVVDDLAAQGINLVITEYSDYVLPNTAVEDGEEDANYFQHKPYLDDQNASRGLHLVSVAAIHYEPLGIYPGKTTALSDLPDDAVIAVPSDTSNEARALQLLQAQGIIKLKDGAGLTATPNDIVENPKNVTFMEIEAAMLPRTIADVDLAVINGNYAIDAGFSASDALAIEDKDSEAAQTYANLIVVKEGNENNPAILALVKALQSDKVRDFINETYNGSVVPMF
ncbi:MAG TPA: MetQ/NlpA family ABC transporter substrate-binding protein [Oscillospiraceae bacterium]|nr:MetQ/NlpA family ABC transporter substrate-binding protein [Oscillospiraceae bacterium]